MMSHKRRQHQRSTELGRLARNAPQARGSYPSAVLSRFALIAGGTPALPVTSGQLPTVTLESVESVESADYRLLRYIGVNLGGREESKTKNPGC